MKRDGDPGSAARLWAIIGLVLILGVVDCVTGYYLQFFLFYFIPVALAAWWCSPYSAYGIAALCAVVWYVADALSGNPLSFTGYAIWNTVIRLLTFMAVAYMVARIRILLRAERKISEDLRAAIAENQTLSGLLPICARCKKIRDVAGYWHQVEAYVEAHSTAEFTHGLCENCIRLTLKESGLSDETAEPSSSRQR